MLAKMTRTFAAVMKKTCYICHFHYNKEQTELVFW